MTVVAHTRALRTAGRSAVPLAGAALEHQGASEDRGELRTGGNPRSASPLSHPPLASPTSPVHARVLNSTSFSLLQTKRVEG